MTKDSPYALVSLIRQVWFYAGKQRPQMVAFYGLLVVANLFILARPLILAKIINAIQTGGPEMLCTSLVWCAVYAGSIIGFWSFHGPARVIERRVAFVVYQRFVADLYAKVTEMPLTWHQDHHSGATINRVTKASKALFKFAQDQFTLIQTTVLFVGSLMALGFYSWWVTGIVALGIAGLFASVRRFDQRLSTLVRETNEREHHLVAGLYDYIGNIITVLTLRLHGHTREEIGRRFEAMRPPFWEQVVMNEWKWASMSVALVFLLAGIVAAYIGLTVLAGGVLTAGAVVAIFQYQMMINESFFNLASRAETVMQQNMDLLSVKELLEDHARLGVKPRREEGRPWKNLALRELDFTHGNDKDEASQVLRNVNLDLRAGRKIAMIGTSGAGKTTLLSLLRGLREPEQVLLTLDGESFNQLEPLADLATLVPQDSEIFENTVRYNLTLGVEVADDILQRALSIAAFDGVAASLSQGIDTDIRERGVNLSGGQKQRLALARGIIAAEDSSILLLDEPTGSLDLQTESTIFERLFAAFPDKTIVATVHRLHLVPRFDEICLIQDGTVIEQGTFRELLQKDGAFAVLWRDHLTQQER